MSRVGKMPIVIPKDVEVLISEEEISVKGPLGSVLRPLSNLVNISNKDGILVFNAISKDLHSRSMFGTIRALVNNMIIGVTKGFEKKLLLIGVGYKAQAQGNVLNLSLGYSHPINHILPKGVKCTTPTPTEIIFSGIDLRQITSEAAVVRSYREPEPYKGKGIRRSDELIILKETKKK